MDTVIDGIKGLYTDMADWLSSPFRKDMPIGQLLLIFVLFLIVAWIVWDGMRILKTWMDSTTEVVVEAVTS